MARSASRIVVAFLVLAVGAPAYASDEAGGQIVAPTKAVAAAWAREQATASVSKTFTVLQVSYAGLQGADMWSTIAARNAGAREVNPLMDGGYAKGAALKAAMGGATMLAARAMAKKNRKAAVVTMWVLNGVTAAVVVNNVRNARR